MVKKRHLVLLSMLFATCLISVSTVYASPLKDTKNKATELIVEINKVLKVGIATADIEVHVDSSTIQLAGFVDNKDQYNKVNDMMGKYKKRYKIINNVKILPKHTVAHEMVPHPEHIRDEVALRDDIQRTLRDNNYPVENIDVQVRDGHVILSGFVDKNVSLKKIKDVSEHVSGVRDVDNCILYKHA